MKTIFFLVAFTFCMTLFGQLSAQEPVKITLANGTKGEQQTKDQIERLMRTYDLSKWIITRTIVIDEKTPVPHSHPVLTFSTRHIKDDDLMLASFVHEQMHWFVDQDEKKLAGVMKEIKEMFPKVPAEGPEGARNEESTYLHIAVNYLEYRAMRELLGELRAKQVMEFWSTDHYRWIYRTVLERPRDIGTIMFKYGMVPMDKPAPR